jgi:outer membrane scaffolding protein for murein synthesis (MipA/OmpV family)
MADQPPTSSQHTTGKTTEKQSTTMHIPFRNNEAEIFEVTPTTGRKVTVNPARESLAVHSLLSLYLDEPFEEDEMEDVEGMTPGM